MKNKVVLLTSANFFTISKFRYTLISKLIKNGCRVILFSSYDSMSHNSMKRLKNIGAICIETGNGRGSYSLFEALKYIKGYLAILKKYQVDVAINFTLMPMIFGGIVCQLKNLRFVSVVTGLGSQYHRSSIARKVLKFAYKIIVSRSNQTWFVSRSDANIGLQELNLPPDKVKIAYGSGVDVQQFFTKVKNNKSSQPMEIMQMGRIRLDKGIEDFISLSHKLKNNNGFFMTLMGGFDDNQAVKILVNDAVDKGQITKKDFQYDNIECLRSADILLLCSRHEGMPTIILEAMANGVIPVSSNLPVISELNNMGASILSYVMGDVESLWSVISKIEQLTSEDQDKILASNYKFVSEYFQKDKIANIQYNFLSELI
jgi:glycosyltransferase involved in cell wall biosynthesis